MREIKQIKLPPIPQSIIRYRKDGKLDRRFDFTKTKEHIDMISGVSNYCKRRTK